MLAITSPISLQMCNIIICEDYIKQRDRLNAAREVITSEYHFADIMKSLLNEFMNVIRADVSTSVNGFVQLHANCLVTPLALAHI